MPLATWTLAAAGVAMLYQGSPGTGDAPGIAQMKEYKVSAADVGRLALLEAVEGQFVSGGKVVARLDPKLIEQEILVAEARMRQLESEARAAGVSLDVNALESERAFLSESEAARIEMEAAQSSQARDRAELAGIVEEMERQRELVKRGLARNDRLEELQSRRAAIEEAVKSWPRRIDAIEAKHAAASARLAEWRRTHKETAEGGARKTQLKPLYDRIGEQQETIRLLRARLANTILRAPSNAQVSAILARPGDIIRPGDVVMTLVEMEPEHLVAYVEERHGDRIQPGMRAVGRRKSGAREQVEGVVESVSGAVTQIPLRFWANPAIPSWGREVYIRIQASRLGPGEALDISFPGGEAAGNGKLNAGAPVRSGNVN